jgi:hypothetical protein
MRWYKQLIAQKFDGSQKRNKLGRPRVSDEIEVYTCSFPPKIDLHAMQGDYANNIYAYYVLFLRTPRLYRFS